MYDDWIPTENGMRHPQYKLSNVKHPTARELEATPVLESGTADDLHDRVIGRINGKLHDVNVLLSRCSVEDGEPCNNKITFEALIEGRWTEVEWYAGGRS